MLYGRISDSSGYFFLGPYAENRSGNVTAVKNELLCNCVKKYEERCAEDAPGSSLRMAPDGRPQAKLREGDNSEYRFFALCR